MKFPKQRYQFRYTEERVLQYLSDRRGLPERKGLSDRRNLPGLKGLAERIDLPDRRGLPELRGLPDRKGLAERRDLPGLKGLAERIDLSDLRGLPDRKGLAERIDLPDLRGLPDRKGLAERIDMPDRRGLPEKKEEEKEEEIHAVSLRGILLTDFLNHFTHDLAIGRMVQTGEIRKRIPEPEWHVPDCYTLTAIEMPNFTMKLLSSKKKPNRSHIILQLHGGGYVGAMRNKYYVFAGLYNEESGGCSVLVPDYRVAPEHPYPAALEDAYDAYVWLLDRGWKGEQIILAGDSAGGGLSMALTMYLRDHDMPLPGGIIAMSPWTDLSASGSSYVTNFSKDPLFGNTKDSMIYNNPYPGKHSTREPYISPKFGNFEDFPPMLIQVGSLEMLLSDSEDVTRMARESGVHVQLTIYEGMFHVFQMAYLAIPESRRAWEEIGQFLHFLTSMSQTHPV